jgi:carbonic anhydrase
MRRLDFSRRELIKFSAGFLGAGGLATLMGLNLLPPQPVVAGNEMTPDEALKKLMDGNRRFVQGKLTNPNQDLVRLTEVALGQSPYAAILSCADSRVPPEILFDQGLGDLFVVRDAGNVATPEEIGSLEYSVAILGSKVLMVLGHQGCGAVTAALEGGDFPENIDRLLGQIQPAVEEFLGQQNDQNAVKKAVEANVLFQMKRVKTSPVISEKIKSGNLKIVGGYYNLKTGEVSLIA